MDDKEFAELELAGAYSPPARNGRAISCIRRRSSLPSTRPRC